MGCGCNKGKSAVQKYAVYDADGRKVGRDYLTRVEAVQAQGEAGPGATIKPITGK
jgi:hypothetical protein